MGIEPTKPRQQMSNTLIEELNVHRDAFRSSLLSAIVLANRLGLEPRPTVLETVMLPLHYRNIYLISVPSGTSFLPSHVRHVSRRLNPTVVPSPLHSGQVISLGLLGSGI